MSVLDTYQDEVFLDWLFNFFALVPAGFLLAAFCGLLAFGIFSLLNLIRRV